jgi:hypothetical protein
VKSLGALLAGPQSTVVMAYLMYKHDLELEATLDAVKRARDVDPTKELLQYVRSYFEELNS